MVGQTPSGTAIRVRYRGGEAGVLHIYDQLEALIAAARLHSERSFEVWHDEAAQTGSADREIYYIVRGNMELLRRVHPPSQ
jgi:hypothetical protein